MRFVLALLALIMLAGCDSGGSSGGSGSINLECLSIAGDYNVAVQIGSTNENMAISIELDCAFASRSPSTGESYGKLQKVGTNTYYGSGKSPACGNGTFSVTVEGVKAIGVTFYAQCN